MTDKKGSEVQINFFERIKDIIPPSMSLANEVSETLGVSLDSAYRRLRGETPISIEEIASLMSHFKFGFDIFGDQVGAVSFTFNPMNVKDEFQSYIQDIYNTLSILSKSENSEVFYAATDIPIFHHFNYPDLAAFKIFYWLKDVLNIPEYETSKYTMSIVPDDLKTLGKQLYEAYTKVQSVEIWTEATVNSSIAQIEFYWDSGLIQNKSEAMNICQQFEDEIRTIQKQAEHGSKLFANNIPMTNNFKLYFSEIEIGNNCILTRKGELKTVFLSFHTFNKMATVNNQFCDDTFKWLSNLMRKSSLISEISEKQRYIFFKHIYDKIARLKVKIENSD